MEKTVKARLVLENGMVFHGKAFGHIKETVGEVVFTTGTTGYQETLSDPSFGGQIVCMTYPLIGNYGINLEDMESETLRLSGLIVREKCDYPSNWRCEMDLAGFLKQHKIMGIEGIDTRALTRILRDNGTMKGIITTRNEKDLSDSQVDQKFSSYSNRRAVEEATCKESYVLDGRGVHFAVMDFGIKRGILKSLQKRNCKLTVFPAFTTVEEVLAVNPDGIFLSNGPGDPENIPQVLENVKAFTEKLPVVGICLGHQLISLATGCKVERMKFGHHGGNHPVKSVTGPDSGRCYITSQNHEFVVSGCGPDMEATYINVNDGTIEGVRHKHLPVASVQFHPEASPGPLDTEFIFDQFIKIAEERRVRHA